MRYVFFTFISQMLKSIVFQAVTISAFLSVLQWLYFLMSLLTHLAIYLGQSPIDRIRSSDGHWTQSRKRHPAQKQEAVTHTRSCYFLSSVLRKQN
jgi:hypothetical protein